MFGFDGTEWAAVRWDLFHPTVKTSISVFSLGTLLALESLAPIAGTPGVDWRKHGRQLAMGAVNALISSLAFAGAWHAAAVWSESDRFGLWAVFPEETAWRAAIAVVLIDFWQYAWHWMNHRWPWLWRFHRVHHADRAMSTTTGVRFHPGEIVASGIARLAVIPLAGFGTADLIRYELLALPVVLWQHSRWNMPEWLERPMSYFLVTPRWHWIHHAPRTELTNSHFASVFPWWDWMCGTSRAWADATHRTSGLESDGDETNEQESLLSLWAAPWKRKPE